MSSSTITMIKRSSCACNNLSKLHMRSIFQNGIIIHRILGPRSVVPKMRLPCIIFNEIERCINSITGGGMVILPHPESICTFIFEGPSHLLVNLPVQPSVAFESALPANVLLCLLHSSQICLTTFFYVYCNRGLWGLGGTLGGYTAWCRTVIKF